jgi:hypothetical protein
MFELEELFIRRKELKARLLQAKADVLKAQSDIRGTIPPPLPTRTESIYEVLNDPAWKTKSDTERAQEASRRRRALGCPDWEVKRERFCKVKNGRCA